MENEKKDLNVQESLQEFIMSKNKEKNQNKNANADDLFGKMVGEDLKALPPISKVLARNEIQNVLFKYRMAAMQYSLQRKVKSTTMVDDTFLPSKTGKPNHRTISEINLKLIFRQILPQTFQVGTIIGYTEWIWTVTIFLR